MTVTTIGLDLGKRYFQVHGVDDAGEVVVTRKLTRAKLEDFFAKLPRCLVGIEACPSAHHWGRILQDQGHEVKLIPPQYVKPYVRRNKSDAADAAAICEAVSRPHMRFVPLKTAEQQAQCTLPRSRDTLIAQRTALVNCLRGHMAEFGIVEPKGRGGARALCEIIEDTENARLPDLARQSLSSIAKMIKDIDGQVAELDRLIGTQFAASDLCRLLATIPGIGVLTAFTFVAAVTDPSYFRSGREFAAWLGSVPRQNSTGGRECLGGISKRGNARLRGLLGVCASSILQGLKRSGKLETHAPWLARLCETKKPKVVLMALANKLARIIWAVMTTGESYSPDKGFLNNGKPAMDNSPACA